MKIELSCYLIWKNQRFSCVCKPGFTGPKCEEDINECESENPCQHTCKNTHGSFKCLCDPGFIIKNIHECVDLDECLNDTTCGENSVCINTPGSYRLEKFNLLWSAWDQSIWGSSLGV